MRKPSQPALCLPIELWSNLSNSVNKPVRNFGTQSFLLSWNFLFLRYLSEQHNTIMVGIPWQNSNQNKTIAQRTGTYLGENVRATIPAETAGNFAFYLRCGALDRVIGWERRDPNSAPLSVCSAPAHPRAPPRTPARRGNKFLVSNSR